MDNVVLIKSHLASTVRSKDQIFYKNGHPVILRLDWSNVSFCQSDLPLIGIL